MVEQNIFETINHYLDKLSEDEKNISGENALFFIRDNFLDEFMDCRGFF